VPRRQEPSPPSAGTGTETGTEPGTDSNTTDINTTDINTTANGEVPILPDDGASTIHTEGGRLVVLSGVIRRARHHDAPAGAVAIATNPSGNFPHTAARPHRFLVAGRAFRLPGSRLGLRARITAMFGFGALVLSVFMGVGTYLVARQFSLQQRDSIAVRQTFVDALVARSSLRSSNSNDIVALLESLDTSGSRSLLVRDGRWYSASVPLGESSIPLSMRRLVASGTAGSQLIELDGSPELVVGVPIPSVGVGFFEVISLEDVARSLQILALALAGAGVVTTIAGTVIGRWASGRAIGPLSDVSHAAEIIARGQLDTRLQTADDADLAPLAESFNRMTDALQERIEREARFTSDVSHELRSPLTTLSTAVGVIEAHAEGLSPRGRTALGLLATEIRHFQKMVDDLLEISRVDTGAAVLSNDNVEVAELVDHMASAGSARGIPIAIDPAVAHLRLSVDKRRIERVIANLVSNAAQYAGGATLLSAEPAAPDQSGTPTWVHLVVTDRGPGIAPDERHRIFERFYRGSASGRRGDTEGTGLGLALVAEHVRLHRGRVWVEDGPNGDHRFVVALPVRQAGGDSPERPPTSGHARPEQHRPALP